MTGADLRIFRAKYHLTQTMLGQLLGGVSKFTISHAEAGRIALHPSANTLLFLMQYRGVRVQLAERAGVTLPQEAL